MPSEKDQSRACVEHFEQYLIQKYKFSSQYELKRAVRLIRDFEEEEKAFNPFHNEFDNFDDRYNEKNEEKI